MAFVSFPNQAASINPPNVAVVRYDIRAGRKLGARSEIVMVLDNIILVAAVDVEVHVSARLLLKMP